MLIILLQEISNTLAKLSVYACARLGGYLLTDEDTTPDNPAIKKSLSALLTPYLAKKFSDNSPHEVTNNTVILIIQQHSNIKNTTTTVILIIQGLFCK